MAITGVGFVQGQSDNLPKVSVLSMFSFLGNNPNFMGAELKGVVRSARESYGDNALGWVQVKRDGYICIVKAKVTAEHNVRKKAYTVKLECNEKDETILSVQCEDCAASLGGCKHAVSLLTWVHRRSEEPSKTSTKCYWKKFALSKVGTHLKLVKAEELGKKNPLQTTNDSTFLQSFVNHSLQVGTTDNVIMKYFKKDSEVEKLSLHRLLEQYMVELDDTTADAFFTFCTEKMSEDVCTDAARVTVDQVESNLWHELRYLRITATFQKYYRIIGGIDFGSIQIKGHCYHGLRKKT